MERLSLKKRRFKDSFMYKFLEITQIQHKFLLINAHVVVDVVAVVDSTEEPLL